MPTVTSRARAPWGGGRTPTAPPPARPPAPARRLPPALRRPPGRGPRGEKGLRRRSLPPLLQPPPEDVYLLDGLKVAVCLGDASAPLQNIPGLPVLARAGGGAA